MELVLKVIDGTNAGQEIKIPGPKFFIGRAEDCQLRPKSDLISRHHCVIMIEEGFAAIRDFGSKNGTLINDQRVVGEQDLHNGDTLQVGHLKFEVQVTQSVGGKKLPAVKDIKEAVARTAEKSKSSGGIDISQWLEESDDEPTTNKETRPLELTQTAEIQETLAGAAPPASVEEAAAPAAEEKAAGKSGFFKGATKKTYGKLPPIPNRGAADSREAAADTLKKLFKGR